MTFDKRARSGDTPELICRRCGQDVCSVAYKKGKKWKDAADAHVRKKCVKPPQVSLEYRPAAPALGAPQKRGLVFVARGCLDKGLCDNAVREIKDFPETGWSLIDPRLDGEGKSDNRRQRPIRASDGNRKTAAIRTVGQTVTDELSQALKGGHTRTEQYLVIQLGTGYQDGHKDCMFNKKGDWQDDSATWFACLAARRDFFLPGFGPVTLEQGDVTVLFANTWHAGMAEQAGAGGSEAPFGYFDRATNFCAADGQAAVGPILDAVPGELARCGEVNIFACNKFEGLRDALQRELKIE